MATNEQEVPGVGQQRQQEADEAAAELFDQQHARAHTAHVRQVDEEQGTGSEARTSTGPETDPHLVQEEDRGGGPGGGGDRGGRGQGADLPRNTPVADLELGGRDFAKEHGYYEGLRGGGDPFPRTFGQDLDRETVAVPQLGEDSGAGRDEAPVAAAPAGEERAVDPEVQRVADLARVESEMRTLRADTRAAETELRGLGLRNPKDDQDREQIAALEGQRDAGDRAYIDLSLQHGPEQAVRAELAREHAQLTVDQRAQLADAYPDLAETAATAAERGQVERGGLGAEREGHELEISR